MKLSPPCKWSNRILILAILGVLFFTLLPFHFDFHTKPSTGRSPFLLGNEGLDRSTLSQVLNILLFVPLGFGITEKLSENGKSRLVSLVGAVTLGALLSYSVEFLQLYVPSRGSGWWDIVTNTSGSFVGFLLFQLCGVAIRRLLSASESMLHMLLTSAHAAVVLGTYFALWILISIPLQMQTRLDDWDTAPLLLIGNDGSGNTPSWKGDLLSLQIWNRPLGQTAVRERSWETNPSFGKVGLVGFYDFSSQVPFRDQTSSLPNLFFGSTAPEQRTMPLLDGVSFLSSRIPVTTLVRQLQRTDQFAIRVVCRPANINQMSAAIVSLSQAGDDPDLALRQDGENLNFVLRNPVLTRRSVSWDIKGVLTPQSARDIIVSYNGDALSFFVDGRLFSGPTRLGPGTALAAYFRHIKVDEMGGYTYIYYFLVFFSGGILIGIATRSEERRRRSMMLRIGFYLIPALLLEAALVAVASRSPSGSLIALSICLGIAGSLWINADRQNEFHSRATG